MSERSEFRPDDTGELKERWRAYVQDRRLNVTAQREAILPLVLAGAGATLFPRPLAEQAAVLGAVVVALRPRLARPVHLFHRSGPLSPAAAAFRELALR